MSSLQYINLWNLCNPAASVGLIICGLCRPVRLSSTLQPQLVWSCVVYVYLWRCPLSCSLCRSDHVWSMCTCEDVLYPAASAWSDHVWSLCNCEDVLYPAASLSSVLQPLLVWSCVVYVYLWSSSLPCSLCFSDHVWSMCTCEDVLYPAASAVLIMRRLI